MGGLLQFDLDWPGEHLLASQHDGVFHGDVEVAEANLRMAGARGFQKIGQGATDAANFQTNIFHDSTRGTGCRQIATDNLDDSGDSGERVANLVGQAGGQLAKRGQVFRARDLGAMQAFDLLAALAQLLHHVIEVAAEVADFVVALGEADRDVQVALAHLLNFFLQFDHGPLNQVGEDEHGDSTDCDRSGAG